MRRKLWIFVCAALPAICAAAQSGAAENKKGGRVVIHEAKDDPDSYARVDELKCPEGFHPARALGPPLKLKKKIAAAEFKGKKRKTDKPEQKEGAGDDAKERRFGEYRCVADAKP